jgi:hypothetical protein
MSDYWRRKKTRFSFEKKNIKTTQSIVSRVNFFIYSKESSFLWMCLHKNPLRSILHFYELLMCSELWLTVRGKILDRKICFILLLKLLRKHFEIDFVWKLILWKTSKIWIENFQFWKWKNFKKKSCKLEIFF